MTHKELVDSLLLASEAAAMTLHPNWAKIMGDAAFVIEQEERYGAFWKEEAIQAKAYLNQLVPKWIPVTERLPEPETEVIVAFDDGQIYSTWQNWEKELAEHPKKDPLSYITSMSKMTKRTATHWMPLPEPPKGEEHE